MELSETLAGAMIAAAVVVITALSTGLRDVLSAWLTSIKNKMATDTYVKQLEVFSHFLREIEELRAVDNVHRVLVFRGHDSGGLPAPGRPYLVRAIYGWAKNKENPDEFEKRPEEHPDRTYGFEILADADYITTIVKVINDGKIDLTVADMPATSKLRRFYEAEGIKHAALMFLGVVDKVNLLFVCVSTYSDTPFSPTDVTKIELMMDKLRSIIFK